MSAPPEYMIVNDIKSKHKLIFIEALGFYEYERGCWNKKEDSAINAYISGELGNYMTGNKISSIAKLMKAERANNNIVFNRKPLFNFKNGTLDLETLEFREHNEADYCSIQADYNYDPSKECPRWEKFIAEICDNDGKRKALMQEISGYVLFDDNSLQKCFMLIGEGANGKSVFLDILTEVFGRKNVSNVEMSGLAESFQRILLMDSILNISTETQTDVKGAESVFKQIVVGDPINGCYKNKDFISFRPRSKIILACNEFIKSKDMTHGFIRRICFVNFPNKFVDEPDPFNDNEKKADKDIISKLMEELPGIFNWALKGYRFLKEVKEFIKTDDEDELVRDFTESINPVLIFMREYPFVEGYDYIWADVYDDYQEWCKKSGHMYRSRHYFIRTFKPLFLKEHRNYEEFQSGSKRGVRQKCANSVQNSVQTEAAIEEHEQKMMNLHT
jgi:P4 family phage/plasmid primase-like protien